MMPTYTYSARIPHLILQQKTQWVKCLQKFIHKCLNVCFRRKVCLWQKYHDPLNTRSSKLFFCVCISTSRKQRFKGQSWVSVLLAFILAFHQCLDRKKNVEGKLNQQWIYLSAFVRVVNICLSTHITQTLCKLIFLPLHFVGVSLQKFLASGTETLVDYSTISINKIEY